MFPTNSHASLLGTGRGYASNLTDDSAGLLDAGDDNMLDGSSPLAQLSNWEPPGTTWSNGDYGASALFGVTETGFDYGLSVGLSRPSGGGGGGSKGSTTPPPTLVSSSNGDISFNLIWDSSVGGAGANEAPFMSAVETAAKFYADNYTAPSAITININVGYGEVAGTKLPLGAISASSDNGDFVTYTTLYNALKSTLGGSSDPSVSSYISNLPDPTTVAAETGQSMDAKDFFLSYAEEKALGLNFNYSPGYGATPDGWIGIAANSKLTPMDYTDDSTLQKTGAMPNSGYDAIGAAAHEIREVMGGIAGLGTTLVTGTGPTWTALDLARYTGANAPDLTTKSGYFSLDQGTTNLGNYNTSAGDAGDWASSAYDSYGFFHAGQYAPVSATDLLETAVLGYNLTATGLANASSPKFV